MTKIVEISEFGGPSVLKITNKNLEKLKPNEVLVQNKSIGLNFIDTYHRSGLYPLPLPSGIGLEAAGEIIEMSPEGPLHCYTLTEGVKYLRSILEDKAEVQEAHPITLSDSEPEPDITIIKSPNSRYPTRHPYPEDIYWLIEIANTTLTRD